MNKKTTVFSTVTLVAVLTIAVAAFVLRSDDASASESVVHHTFYVDPSVAVSGDGLTPETAFKTLREVSTILWNASNISMDRGADVYLAPGTYDEASLYFPVSTTLHGAGMGKTIISSRNLPDGPLGGWGVNPLIFGGHKSISTVKDLTILPRHDAIAILHNNGGLNLIRVHIDGGLTHLLSDCGGMDCSLYGVNIYNSLFTDSTLLSVQLASGSVNDADFIVANNIFSGNPTAIHEDYYAFIKNNIFVNNVTAVSTEYLAGGEAQNNLFWNNGTNFNKPENWDSIMGSINADPMLTSDHRLQDGSPAIDAGINQAAFNDLDGSRNDLGMYGGPHAPETMIVTATSAVSPAAGEAFSLTFNLDYQGGTAENTTVVVTLPAEATYVDNSAFGATASQNGSDITLSLAELTGSKQIGFQVETSSGLTDATALQFSYTVTWDGGTDINGTVMTIVNGITTFLPLITN